MVHHGLFAQFLNEPWGKLKILDLIYKPDATNPTKPGGGGGGGREHSTFFSGRGVQPGFPKCGACELIFASERRGLSAENYQILGLES